MMNNLPKEVTQEIYKQNRIKEYGSDFTVKTTETKAKAVRETTSKGKIVFKEHFDDGGEVDGAELYKIAKYAVDNEVGDAT